jgi:hypothetical protein
MQAAPTQQQQQQYLNQVKAEAQAQMMQELVIFLLICLIFNVEYRLGKLQRIVLRNGTNFLLLLSFFSSLILLFSTGKSGNNLDIREQTCLSNCVDRFPLSSFFFSSRFLFRYFETMNVVSSTLANRQA